MQISEASSSTADTTGSNIDVTFSPSTVTFTKGTDTLKQTVTLNVKADNVAEVAEFIELELGDSGDTRTSNGNAFSFGRQTYRLNIPANDNTVSIDAQSSSNTLVEDGTDYSAPATLEIPADQNTGIFTVTGIDDELEQGELTLTLEFTGDLPDGRAFTAGQQTVTSLTHSLTINDNEVKEFGWEETEITIAHPGSTSRTDNLTFNLTGRFPDGSNRLNVRRSGTAVSGMDYVPTGCDSIRLSGNGKSASLNCRLFLVAHNISVGDTIIFELVEQDNPANPLADEGITISPDTLKVTIGPSG